MSDDHSLAIVVQCCLKLLYDHTWSNQGLNWSAENASFGLILARMTCANTSLGTKSKSYSSVIAAIQSGFFRFIQWNDYTLVPFLQDNFVCQDTSEDAMQCSHSFSATMLRYIWSRHHTILVPCLPCLELQLAWVGMCQLRGSGVDAAASDNKAKGGGCRLMKWSCDVGITDACQIPANM